MVKYTFEVTDIISGEQRSITYPSADSIVDEFTAKILIKQAFNVIAVGDTQVSARGVVKIGNYSVYAS